MDATRFSTTVERPAPHSLSNKTRPTYIRDAEPTLRRQNTNDLASVLATSQHAAKSTTAGRTRTRPLLSESITALTPRAIPHPTTTSLQQAHSAALAPIRSTASRFSYRQQQCEEAMLNRDSMPPPQYQLDSQHIELQGSIAAATHTSASSAPLSSRIRSDSSSSTSTTSVSYLRSAAEAVIANAHQTHFQQYPPPDNASSHSRPTGNWTRAQAHSQYTLGSDGSNISFSSMQSSLFSPSRDIRLDSYNIDPTRGLGAGQQSQGSAQGFDSTTPPFPELGPQASTLYWHQQDKPAVLNDGRTLHHVSQSLTSSNSEQQHLQRRVHDGVLQLQRGKDSSTYLPQLPLQSGCSLFPRPENASTMTDNTPGGSWVSDLNEEEKGIARRQHDFHLRHSTPATDVTPSTLRQTDTQDSEDREVYRVCRGRMAVSIPGRNNDKKLMGTIQSSYLASRGGYKEGARGSARPHHTTLKELPREQGQSPQQDHEGYTLTDRQENNGSRRFTHPQFDVEHQEHHRDSLNRSREQEWLSIIARLEQQVADLDATNEELRSRLHDSEQRFDRLIVEQDTKMHQLKEEHDHSVLDTKHRTKRLFDQVMRKQRLDEGKRLATVFKELQGVQLENTDLHTRIQTIQESTLAIQQDSKDDASVLHAFWDRELMPRLRIEVPLHGQETLSVREKSPPPSNRRTNSLWDSVHGQGQRQGRTGVSKTAVGGTKSSAVAAGVSTSDADADADADADSDDGKGVKRGLSFHACKTPLGQQCLALLQKIMAALNEPQDSRDHGCSGQELHCRFAGQEQERFMDRRQQRKRYSDSSASSGKTIVALHSRQPSHVDYQGRTVSSCGTILRQDPVKYFGELRVEHQREIERIKTQCVLVYRESLEVIRAEMVAKMRSKSRVGCDKR